MKEKVSIIIPAYNVENYIFRAIESSINQTYKNIEIVIVDDGSKDNTWDVIKKYMKKDNRIVGIRQQNSGVSTARNNGLAKATGEYVIFLDSDDWINIDCISSLLNRVEKSNNTLISADCSYASIDKNGEVIIEESKKNYSDKDIVMDKKDAIINFCCAKYRLSSACYKLFDLKIIRDNKIQFDSAIKYGEDGLFVYDYLNRVDSFSYKNECLWIILDRPGSATTSQYNSTWLTAIDASEKIIRLNDDVNLEDYIKLYSIVRIITVLSSAIRCDKNVIKDIKFLRKKLKSLRRGIRKEKTLKKKALYYVMAYSPIWFIKLMFKIREVLKS